MLVDQLPPAALGRLVTIPEEAPLVEAARLFDTSTSLVVVCDVDGMMVGVLTKTDIVSRIGRCQGSSCMTAASDVMTRNVTYCHPHAQLRAAWDKMRECGLKHIPIVDRAFSPVGVLNARQAVQALFEELGNEDELLRQYVMGIGYR